MKVQTSSATPLQLDWAVAKCEGRSGTGRIFYHGANPMMEADLSSYSYQDAPESAYDTAILPYSTDWAQGGPIIEREGIDLYWLAHATPDFKSAWQARIVSPDHGKMWIGPTPLISAMRCYVASKLGDEIETPEELK